MSTPAPAPQKRCCGCLLPLFLVLGVFVAIGGLLWPAIESAREAARRANCIGQNKFFGLAIHTYVDSKGYFPSAYIADKQGRPAHSWRVVLLQMDMVPLYERYRFDEAWDSPHNRDLAGGLPMGMSGVYPWYHCATDRGSGGLDTSYVMVVGPDTISPGPKSRRLKEITDGISNTAIIGEMSESGIHWMEPRDLDFQNMSFKINDKNGQGIRSKHPGIATVVFADGGVRSLSEDTDPEIVRALFTINGGKRVPWEVFQ